MRALFTTQPGFGHLNPFLPYAVALRDAGHEVRFATAPAFAEAVEAHGFDCVGLGEDFTWERAHEYFPESIEAAKRGRGVDYAIFDIGWKRWGPKAARDLIALFEEWRPDLIVREFGENGATLAGAHAGIPVVCAAWTALPTDARAWSHAWDWDRWVGAYATAARELGMPERDPMEVWAEQLVLSALPPSWFGDSARSARLRHFRVEPAEGPAAPPPEWLAAAGRERPLVYATLGTVFNRLRRVRSAMLAALAEVDADVLMTVGRDVEPAEVGAVPPNVRVESFVPQSQVLSRADLVVSHAGLGTMLGAIYHGVPMVVIAVGGDQPVNAVRAAEAGLGRALTLDQALPGALEAAIDATLADAGMRERALSVREECAAMAPLDAVVDLLEREVAV